MSSPIHRFLFSPPTSPRLLPTDGKGRAPHLTSLKSLIPAELMPSSLDNSDYSNGLRPRSPRTPQQKHFTLDAAYPGGLPSPRNTGSVILQVEDLDATPRLKSGRTTPTQSYPQEKSVTSPTFLPVNIPSAPLPISSGLPRPLLRLMFLASLVLASIVLLVFVPAARLPSLHTASVARRLALDTEGYAYNDVVNPITSHQDALDRDYAPPQIKAAHMMKRSFAGQVIDAENAFLAGFMRNPAIAPPKANRPSPAAQPLPPSHELLALQSYLLESSYNRLTSTVNPLEPLDANILLGFEPSPLALGELEREREHEVVVWYGSNGLSNLPHDLLDMISEAHGTSRKPTLLPIHSRPDRSTILSVLERLGLPLNRSPLLVIGNKAYVADQQTLSNLKTNGRLSELLSSIGWVRTEKDGKTVKKTAWRPKMAKVGKKVTTEIEDALNQVKK